ncbi:hypothetical protein C8Q76DRAFT_152731 [Earliella scabrosa]|nr:hypothetical protein C8Q76DRAFT_152731 [Earliella scabrosa]
MVEHADDADGPRRRKLPSRAGRSPSPDPPPREQRSRYFPAEEAGPVPNAGGKVTLRGPGTDAALKEFARTIGLSPPRAPPVEIPDTDDEDSSYGPPASGRATRPGTRAGSVHTQDPKQTSKSVQKQKATDWVEPSSDDLFDKFDMDANFFEEVDRVEEEALKREGGSTQPRTQTQVQRTQVKTEGRSQATSATLVSTAPAAATSRTATATGRGSSASRNTPVPNSRATSALGTSSSGSKGQPSVTQSDVITIDDDEDTEKENVPIPTRRTRMRIARRVDEDVIELSD